MIGKKIPAFPIFEQNYIQKGLDNDKQDVTWTWRR